MGAALQVYEVNRKLLQEHAAPLMAVYLHGVAVVRQELNMDVARKSIKGVPIPRHATPLGTGHQGTATWPPATATEL